MRLPIPLLVVTGCILQMQNPMMGIFCASHDFSYSPAFGEEISNIHDLGGVRWCCVCPASLVRVLFFFFLGEILGWNWGLSILFHGIKGLQQQGMMSVTLCACWAPPSAFRNVR